MLQLIVMKKMTYDFYSKKSKQMIELNLNMIVYRNPQLINVLDKSIDHTLF